MENLSTRREIMTLTGLKCWLLHSMRIEQQHSQCNSHHDHLLHMQMTELTTWDSGLRFHQADSTNRRRTKRSTPMLSGRFRGWYQSISSAKVCAQNWWITSLALLMGVAALPPLLMQSTAGCTFFWTGTHNFLRHILLWRRNWLRLSRCQNNQSGSGGVQHDTHGNYTSKNK